MLFFFIKNSKINQKRMLTPSMKLADVVQSNFDALSVISRFGISLGFGDRLIGDVCQKYGINTDFFLEILNTFNGSHPVEENDIKLFSVVDIVNYLRKTHNSYRNESVPVIEDLLKRLIDGCSQLNEINLVHNLFDEYKNELLRHISWEDDDIFPYALSVEGAYLNKINQNDVIRVMRRYSMSDFLDEHDDIEAKLCDIRILFIKYLPPVADQLLCIKLLRELHLLERDINNHARIEEKVLGPKVIAMEKILIQNK